jgi:hypothetical protein
MAKTYEEMNGAERNQHVRDMCRVTGCSTVKGAKTERQSFPVGTLLVFKGQPIGKRGNRLYALMSKPAPEGKTFMRLRRRAGTV